MSVLLFAQQKCKDITAQLHKSYTLRFCKFLLGNNMDKKFEIEARQPTFWYQ